MELFLGGVFFLMGLCAGSFVNMLMYRTAERYEITQNTKPAGRQAGNLQTRSFCDYCGRQLKWFENIPIISWLVLQGKSRCCQTPLPWEYPVVEMGTGLLFLVQFLILQSKFMIDYQNINLQTLGWLVVSLIMLTLLIFSAVFDLKYMILPDFSTYILTAVSFVVIIFDKTSIVSYLLTAVGSFGFLLVLHLLTKGKGMGFGDVKLAFFMGLVLGWPRIVAAFYIAFISAGVIGLVLIAFKIIKRKTPIPFGPFLIGGTILAWYYGSEILEFVLKWGRLI